MAETARKQMIEVPRFADNPRSRLLMTFIGGWVIVAIVLAGMFQTGSQYRADSTMMRLAQVMVCYGLCSGIALVVSRFALSKSWSDGLGYVLMGAMTVAGIGMAVNLSGYCQFPGTFDNPYFGNAYDFEMEWQRIVVYKATGDFIRGTNIGFTYIASLAVDRMGPGIAGLLMLNVVFMCGTVAVTSRIATVLLPDSNRKKTSLYAAIAIASVASVIWYATVPLKESGVTFAFTLFALSIAKLYRGNVGVSGIVAAALGGFLLMMLKGSLGWLLVPGIIIAWLPIGKERKVAAMGPLYSSIILMLIAGSVIMGGRNFRFIKDEVLVGAVESQREGMEDYMTSYSTVQKYKQLIPDYFIQSPAQRLLQLPLTASAQYFPPFPWNYLRDKDEGRFVWYAHLSIFWYILGGAAIGYVVLCIWRQKARGGLGWWALWGGICYLAIAYYSGGTVARYYLPFIPCFVPLALRMVQCARRKLISPVIVKIYCCAYVAVMAVALTLAFNFLNT